jgi:hypothetical protein
MSNDVKSKLFKYKKQVLYNKFCRTVIFRFQVNIRYTRTV